MESRSNYYIIYYQYLYDLQLVVFPSYASLLTCASSAFYFKACSRKSFQTFPFVFCFSIHSSEMEMEGLRAWARIEKFCLLHTCTCTLVHIVISGPLIRAYNQEIFLFLLNVRCLAQAANFFLLAATMKKTPYIRRRE